MKKYWFTGDWHLGHANILHLCNRPFKTIEEHDAAILSNHNSVVKDEDVVFNFGDVGYRCSCFYIVEQLKKFNGKLVIILGNHDKALREALQKGMLDKEIFDGKIEIVGGKAAVFDKSLALSKMLEFDGQRVFISHYACRTWPSAFRGAWHLYAHSHNHLPQFYKSFDIGVDTNNFFPYDLETIKNRMDLISPDFKEGNDASCASGQE
jgi:calcineurin-like phosphoesterase family protein